MTTPQLDERRVDAMRESILQAVDADVARRGRRTRRALGGLAAACLVVVIGGVGLSQLTTTGGSDSLSAADTASAPEMNTATEDAGGGTTLRGQAAPVAPRDTREVVTTGSVDVTVDDPRDVATRFSAWVEQSGGRVDGRTESTDVDGRASASMTVRVPSTRVSTALDELRSYGDVGTVDIQNDDVTAQGQDLDARIKALEISIDRLETILSGAGSSAEVVRAEDALTQRQEQLESLQAQRNALSDRVALSSLHVELVQEGSAASVEPGGFQGGLTQGWNALVDTPNAIVALAGVLLPWLAVAAVLGGLWWAVRRLSGRRARGAA